MVRGSVFGKSVVAAMMAESLVKQEEGTMTSEHGKTGNCGRRNQRRNTHYKEAFHDMSFASRIRNENMWSGYSACVVHCSDKMLHWER